MQYNTEPINPEFYDADYYLNGVASGKSLYTDYRWLPELSIPMAKVIAWHLRLKKKHVTCDFGCARGFLVKALRSIGHAAFGVDASPWAVENCEPNVKPYIFRKDTIPSGDVDWVIAKDVLEHIPEARQTVEHLLGSAQVGVFAVVPLALINGEPYVCLPYENDVSHCQRLSLHTWVSFFLRPGWDVEASYRIQGIKDNWYKEGWEMGNGFITARRTA